MEIDHITSGDVQTVLIAIIAIALSTWATLLTAALLFSRKSEAARRYFEATPGVSILIGLILGGLAVVVSLGLLRAPNPVLKLVGWGGISLVAAVSAVGGGGLALLVGGRIEGMESGGRGFWALARGAALLVLVGLVPVFGWFAYVPVVMLASFGAGLQALLHKPATAPAALPAGEPR